LFKLSKKVGKFLEEETYEWFGMGTNDKGSISLEASQKWRTSVALSRLGAFQGVCVVFYGDCPSPPLDTMKCAIKAGGGVVLAMAPPYICSTFSRRHAFFSHQSQNFYR
jgi:hypothetical protein